MMSTISGLIVGVLIAALVTVLYGQQLSSSLRHAIDKHPAVKALLEQPQPEQSREITVAMLSADETGELTSTASDRLAASAVTNSARWVEPAKTDTPLAQTPALGKSAAASEKAAESNIAHGEESNLEQRAEPNLEQGAEPNPEQQAEPNLEQRWSEYAASADKLLPVGSFPWQRCFQRSAASYDLPLALLLAIASGESDFDPAAHSDKNAIGLMQIRWPITSRHLGVRRQADLYDPCTNVDAGARYLRELAQHYADNLHLAVAAYNYGPARVSLGQVPEGALWYSHYIYQHLQQVLGLEPSATSELIPAPARPDAGREVLMTFTRAHRARDFIAFLSRQIPGLNLQQQSESLGRHEVVLLYSSEVEKRRAIQALTAAGLEILGPPSNPSYHL
ncbi:MAG: transglycosylase SLT domain-containing protein [Gammaproteobacteria bacterium]|nr:transglycosylase SLT domain-containing protein [Gammaproteobacteria bacterium]